ncbi:MAG: tyrosine-type recombinase/integrase [Deltaproteobacteria bacterium]|nr:tyrosine-type recombinase/integrase [Deltaproteobacteria bacterium]
MSIFQNPCDWKGTLALIGAFRAYLLDSECAPSTARAYGADLTQFASILARHCKIPWEGDEQAAFAALAQRAAGAKVAPPANSLTERLLEVSKGDLEAYLQALRDPQLEYSPLTIRRKFDSVRSFYRWACAQRLTSANKGDLLPRIPTVTAQPQAVVEAELRKLSECILGEDIRAVRDRAILAIFVETGVRLTELTALDNRDFSGGKLQVGRTTAHSREFDLSPSTIELLRQHQARQSPPFEDDAPLFRNKHGSRLSPRGVRRRFERYAKDAGLVSKVTPRGLRNLRRVLDFKSGVSLRGLRQRQGVTALDSLNLRLLVAASPSSVPVPAPASCVPIAVPPPRPSQSSSPYGRATPLRR